MRILTYQVARSIHFFAVNSRVCSMLNNGGDGNDLLNGEAGNDVLIGGSGNNVFDGGLGRDTVDYSNAENGVVVNLTDAIATNNGYGGRDIIFSTENITGSAFDDNIVGNAQRNIFNGGDGKDVLDGGLGNDELIGGSGNDELIGGPGIDVLIGGSGDNVLDGGSGSIDTADYSDAKNGVVVNLTTGAATNNGNGGSDGLINIENVIGSAFTDNITGNSGDNTINGGGGIDNLDGKDGNDVLIGGSGNNVLDGGSDIDTADYSNAKNGVVVNLFTGVATNNGNGGKDTLISIENVTGSAFNDVLLGGLVNHVLTGGAGNDIIEGGTGNDILFGGPGEDTLRGFSGQDRYKYTNIDECGDTIVFFNPTEDVFDISGFPGLSTALFSNSLSSSQFVIGTAPTNDQHRFIYDPMTGRMLFDEDGIGPEPSKLFVTIGEPVPGISASNFVISPG